MLRPDADVPAWLVIHIERGARLLGLFPLWDLELGLADSLGESETNETAAITRLNTSYWQARIIFRRDVTDTPRTQVVALHELDHVAGALADQAVRTIISMLPEAQQPLADRLWQQGDEASTEARARGLDAYLWGSV